MEKILLHQNISIKVTSALVSLETLILTVTCLPSYRDSSQLNNNNAKLSMDNRNVTLALLTDLSKAFDCLPYKLLLSKLHAYGVDRNACWIILSYFTDRKQRVKLGDCLSD